MLKRLVAIGFIFFCTAVAWMVLGSTIFARTYVSDSNLRVKVEQLWVTPQAQQAPSARYTVTQISTEESTVNGTKVTKEVKRHETRVAPLLGSDIHVKLDLEHRQKGLLWYATYRVGFQASYQFRNDAAEPKMLTVMFPFPAQHAIYDDFRFTVSSGNWASKPVPRDGQVEGQVYARAGEIVTVDVAYRSQGMDRWAYRFGLQDGKGVTEIRNFRLVIETDFAEIDFPEDAMAPSAKERSGKGWHLVWQYSDLIAGVNIGILLPQKLQPGPLAGEISFFAPVSLFFFIVVILAFSLLRGTNLHPMHFFFLSAAFFAFHLLLAYLVDHVSIHVAFVAASLVSVGLVVSYLRMVVSVRFAFIEAAIAQLVYLVAFSYAFFFKGFTGLAITIGAILTLFVLMQMTARISWGKVFEKKP